VNALLYMMPTRCQWRMLPGEFPPRSTVQRYFYAWREDGTWQRINHELVMQARLTTLRNKLIKIGAKMVRHGHYVTFQLAEVAISRTLFGEILRLIEVVPNRWTAWRRLLGGIP
jgi:hypothetical protein